MDAIKSGVERLNLAASSSTYRGASITSNSTLDDALRELPPPSSNGGLSLKRRERWRVDTPVRRGAQAKEKTSVHKLAVVSQLFDGRIRSHHRETALLFSWRLHSTSAQPMLVSTHMER